MKSSVIWVMAGIAMSGCGGAGGPGGPGQIATLEPGPGEGRGYVEVENSAYFDWSGFKPGTWVRTREVQEQRGDRRESVSTTRLLERSESRVVVQYGDAPTSQAAYGPRTWVLAGTTKGDGSVILAKGNETLEIRGVLVPCHWTESTFDVQGATCALKSWRSREIPGAVARTQQVWTRAGQVERTMSTVVEDWHIED